MATSMLAMLSIFYLLTIVYDFTLTKMLEVDDPNHDKTHSDVSNLR